MNIKTRIALAYIQLVRYVRMMTIHVLGSLLFKKHECYKKILVNRDGNFGDSIVALPALNIIRQNFPEAQIDLLSINDGNVSFNVIGLKKNLIDNLHSINKQQRTETLKILKKENYDLFIQIPQNIGIYKSIRNMLLVRFYLKINSAFGWDSGRIKSFMGIQKQYGLIPTETARFIQTLKQNDMIGDIHYPLTSQQPKDLKILQLLKTSKPIAFLIGGKLQPKKWPLDHWISLAKLIGEKQKILIIGGDAEKKEGEHIKAKATNVINLCGKFTIPELLYVFENTKVAISLDTGAMHLCDATGIKLIALFSTRDLSNKWFPNNDRSIVIEKVVACSFCLKTRCKNNICMINISPDEVYSKLNMILAN